MTFLRSLSVRRWSERSVILLVMQSRDNSIRLRRSRLGFQTRPGHGEPNPTYLPVANDAARKVADMLDGDPWGAWNETILDAPTTAHILGGCCIGADARRGVIDPYQRLYGHPGPARRRRLGGVGQPRREPVADDHGHDRAGHGHVAEQG